MEMNRPTLGIVSIATNIYLDYWTQQAESISKELSKSFDCTLYLFTDKPAEATIFAKTLSNVKVSVNQIPAYGWPEATLLRFEIMNTISAKYDDETLMYLDADMLIHGPIGQHDLQSPLGNMTLVTHPGYFRRNGFRRLFLYLRSPKLLATDLYMYWKMGALGAWETSQSSLAFVPRSLRQRYFCGGVWWGSRSAFLAMVSELAEAVATDHRNGVMAIWHDESHINSWASRHEHSVAGPEFCYSETFSWISHLPMKIQAVDKVERTR